MLKRFCRNFFHSITKKKIFQNSFHPFSQTKDSLIQPAHNLIKENQNIAKFQENGLNFTIPFEIIEPKTNKKINNSDFLYKLVSPSQAFERNLTLFIIRQYISNLKMENLLDEGANIFFGTKDSSLKLMRYINENKLDDINLLMVSSLFEDYENLMKINVKNNKLNKLLDDEKLQIENKSENDIFLMTYLDLLKMKGQEKYIRFFNVIDMECTDSSSFRNLKNAFQALKKEKSLICLSFEDLSVLQETHKCFPNYGFSKLNLPNNNEHTIRLLYSAINQLAITVKRTVFPILSIVLDDGTIKLYFEIKKSSIDAQKSLLKYSQLFKCSSCPNYEINDLCYLKGTSHYEANYIDSDKNLDKCPYCWSHFYIGGPIWNGNINDSNFVQLGLANLKNPIKFPSNYINYKNEIIGLFQDIINEEKLKSPIFSYNSEEICQFLQMDSFLNEEVLGYFLKKNMEKQIIPSYLNKNLWKTDADKEIIFQIFSESSFSQEEMKKKSIKANEKNVLATRFLQYFKKKDRLHVPKYFQKELISGDILFLEKMKEIRKETNQYLEQFFVS